MDPGKKFQKLGELFLCIMKKEKESPRVDFEDQTTKYVWPRKPFVLHY